MIAKRFAEQKLGTKVFTVAAPGEAFTIAAAIADAESDLKLSRESDSVLLKWQELVEKKQEAWPIQFLMPGGAYIQQTH
jgi:hypothetical protein